MQETIVDGDAILDERLSIEEYKGMPKWAITTIHESRLDAPLPYHTQVGSHHSSYINDSYALVATLCNEEEPITFNEAHKLENWTDAMQSK